MVFVIFVSTKITLMYGTKITFSIEIFLSSSSIGFSSKILFKLPLFYGTVFGFGFCLDDLYHFVHERYRSKTKLDLCSAGEWFVKRVGWELFDFNCAAAAAAAAENHFS